VAFLSDSFIDNLCDEHGNDRLGYITVERVIGIKALYFFNPVEICILPVINNQFQKRKWLI
jgi:hypothetical protein